jgi:hypothetical protein
MNKDNKNSASQSTENNVNKIIKLQTPGTRRVQMKLDISEKKAALTASIISVIAIVTFVNQKILSQLETSHRSNGRGIASIDGSAQYGFQWQRELAQKLAQKSQRSIASYGEAPSKLDEIRFGLLEGKYAFQFSDDKEVSEIHFNNTPVDEKPKYIGNYETFLMDHKDVLMPELSKLKLLETATHENEKEQIMAAFNAADQSIGKVSVVSDLSGRFISMKFTKTN